MTAGDAARLLQPTPGLTALLMTILYGHVVMAHSTVNDSTRLHASTQDVAIHMIAAAARILLMLGTAILIGEVAAGPARKLLEARANHRQSINEDGEPKD